MRVSENKARQVPTIGNAAHYLVPSFSVSQMDVSARYANGYVFSADVL